MVSGNPQTFSRHSKTQKMGSSWFIWALVALLFLPRQAISQPISSDQGVEDLDHADHLVDHVNATVVSEDSDKKFLRPKPNQTAEDVARRKHKIEILSR